MDSLKSTNPPYNLQSEFKAIIAGLIGGGKYGIKIRLPHATVMTLLFRGDATAREKFNLILKSTLEHSCNLASFAAIYKVGNMYLFLFSSFPCLPSMYIHTYCSSLLFLSRVLSSLERERYAAHYLDCSLLTTQVNYY